MTFYGLDGKAEWRIDIKTQDGQHFEFNNSIATIEIVLNLVLPSGQSICMSTYTLFVRKL